MPEPSAWLLTGCERGNPATRLDDRYAGCEAWSTGNAVRPLVHGAAYFADLVTEVRKLRAGDLLLFTDWRGDADERLASDGCISGSCQGAAVDIARVRGASLPAPAQIRIICTPSAARQIHEMPANTRLGVRRSLR